MKIKQQSDDQQPSVVAFLNTSNVYGTRHPDQLKRTWSFINNIIIGCGLSLAITDNEHFRRFMKDLDPKFVLPSRRHMSTALIPTAYQEKTLAIQKLVGDARFVSLTVDIWTDRVMHSYIAVTAHTFVNSTPQSGLLQFMPIDGSHTGQRIAEHIRLVLEEFHLEGKVSFVVSDNASNMKKAFEVLKELLAEEISIDHDDMINEVDNDDDEQIVDESLWQDLNDDDAIEVSVVLDQSCLKRLSCFAHTLQLVVRDGISKLATATGMLAKISKLANNVHQSALFKAAFESKFGVEGKSIPSTNATRWNSVFRQLKSVADLDQMKLIDILKETNHQNLILTSRELGSLQELVEILQPFAEATDLCQGQKYTTIGCVVPCVVSLHKFLCRMEQQSRYHRPAVIALQESLCRRFSGLFVRLKICSPYLLDAVTSDMNNFGDDVYVMASAMDPSFGFIWIEEDHPGDEAVKDQLKDNITGKLVKIQVLLNINSDTENST